MIRLYIDEDSMDRDLVNALRARGVDVSTAQADGLTECTDEEHLLHALREGRVLYSFNRGDFYRLHTAYLAQGKAHAGIILAQQQQYSIGEQLRRLLKLMAAKSSQDMQNQVESLSAWA